ncbi:MAG: DNA primase [Micropruina sp.]|uniref:DNA primase n=1 Tax=Micropruina sp. TaxID=2737536 RepID=UPI0039E34FEE
MRTLPGVPGLINEEDLATVRERSRIEDVVGSYVTLRPGGGGALVGLCPFHDEKTPSFRVTPARGFYYCFGCNVGGDVIGFVQAINNCNFVEAVEFLADRVGVQLRYTDGGGGVRVEPGLRSRILEANRLAAEFFADQLTSPDAVAGRQFLSERGFDRDAAEHFGVGFAPMGGRELAKHLRAHKFTDDELVKASLIRDGGWDYFQARLIWPIRDAGRSVLGFGARRLFDDDRMPAKYINTRETPVYKKSHVLYGLDLARQNIAKKNQAVIVEGYTDVMAAHVAGVDTAVASCGTAFGDDHARLLSRLIGSTDALNGEVIFTFDGDAAGQAAALKVFSGDQHFISQTYVAIEPTGLDPCDLRIQHGDAAVRELVGRREPLYRYVMASTIAGFDLDRVDGRLGALRAAAPLVSSVRDSSLVNGYIHELAKMLGAEVDEVRREVARAGRRRLPAAHQERHQPPAPEPAHPDEPSLLGLPMPNPRDRGLEVERGTLRLMLRAPEVFASGWNEVGADDFTHPTYRAIFTAIADAGVPGGDWPQPVVATEADPTVSAVVAALTTEPLLRPASPGYAAEYVAKLRLLSVARTIAELKSKLQRTNPVDDQPRYNRMFATLLELERQRRELNEIAAGPAS